MTAFTDQLVEANRDAWAAMADHPLVLGLADGTLPDGALQAWGQQDRVFVGEERRVVAALRTHGLLFTRAARFELAFWEMCWSGQAWPG